MRLVDIGPVKEAFAVIEAQHGDVSPERVVEAARDPESPLHKYFTWDIERAANEYLLAEARNLIRTVRVVITNTTQKVETVAYVKNPSKRANEQGYQRVEQIATQPAPAAAALQAELRRVESMVRRMRSVAAALGLEQEAEAMLRELLAVPVAEEAVA